MMKRRFLMAAALAVLVALAGCAPAKTEQTLTIAVGSELSTLDPHRAPDTGTASVLSHIYESLLQIEVDGRVSPHLAEAMTELPGGTGYEIRLRRGITFTDGAPLDAAAVEANLARLLNPDAGTIAGSSLRPITAVNVVDDYTLHLLTDGPFAPLAASLALSNAAMISPALLAAGADAIAATPVGTGPFVLKEHRPGQLVALERNPGYWGEAPALAQVLFRIVKDDGARMIEVESGNVDVAVRVPPTEASRLHAHPQVDVVYTPSLRMLFLFFNNARPPFDDQRVRQAFNYAIDKEAIVHYVLNDAGQVLDAPVPPAVFGHSPQQPYDYDPARARVLLAEAGYPDGLQITLHHPSGRYNQDARIADVIRSQLAEVGVQVDLQTADWGQYVQTLLRPLEQNDMQAAMLGWSYMTADADHGLFLSLHSSNFAPGFNIGFYSNAELDQLLEQARTAGTSAQREALYADIMQRVWTDAPWLFLHSEQQITAVRKGVTGLVIHPAELLLATTASKQ